MAHVTKRQCPRNGPITDEPTSDQVNVTKEQHTAAEHLRALLAVGFVAPVG
jgi:hypothetical protein